MMPRNLLRGGKVGAFIEALKSWRKRVPLLVI